MIAKSILMILAFALSCGNLYAMDLTGSWKCNDGGMYYLRQIGQELYWYGEQNATSPSWSNVFVGSVLNGSVSGKWHDVPKGQIMGSGTLLLTIENNGNSLTAHQKSGGFGGSNWKRLGLSQSQVPPVPPIHVKGCSISGRLLGGEEYWNITFVGIRGPDDFSKRPADPIRIAKDGTYSFARLPPGTYKVYTDIHADLGTGFKPVQQIIKCKGQLTEINFQWPTPQ